MPKKKLPKMEIFEWEAHFCDSLFKVQDFLDGLPYYIAKQAKNTSHI